MDYLENALSGFDGLETFDPQSPFAKVQRPTSQYISNNKKSDARITLRIKNTTNETKRIELFNSVNSITKVPNGAVYNTTTGGEVKPLSVSTFASILATFGYVNRAQGTLTHTAGVLQDIDALQTTAYFDDNSGNLIYNYGLPALYATSAGITGGYWGASGANQVDVAGFNMTKTVGTVAEGAVIISCDQMNYRRFLDNTSTMLLLVREVKMQVNNADQFKNGWEFVYYGDLGSNSNDTLEPNNWLMPENYQTNVIDIKQQMWIDKNTAIYMNVEPDADFSLIFSISAYRDNAVSAGKLQALKA
jgi:hypothetical protein